jgi:Fur family iron response transcriptional regulator
MHRMVEAACRAELRPFGLARDAALVRLLALLRAAPETHFRLHEVVRLADGAALGLAPREVAARLDTLVENGLLGRLPSMTGEPVFDTIPRPHSHLVYEETAQTVDLDVSPETLLAILRQALADRPGEVEVMVRVRRGAAPAGSAAAPPG